MWVSSLTNAADERALDAALLAWADRIRADGSASTLHDWRRGRRMEAESINGFVLKKAIEVGVAAPHHAAMVDLTRKLERGEIKQGLEAIAQVLAM